MARLIIVFAVAFLAALAGGAGASTMQAKKRTAHLSDSLAKHEADSLKKFAKTDSARVVAAAHPDSAAATGGSGEGPDAKAGDHATTAVGEPKGEPKGAKATEHAAVAEADHKVANDAPVSKDAKLAKDAKVAAAKPVKEEMLPSGVIGERLGKIFATMPTKDAAKILAQLDDQDVSLILAKVNDKKAGEMMALLPAERAAAISKKGIAHIASREKTP